MHDLDGGSYSHAAHAHPQESKGQADVLGDEDDDSDGSGDADEAEEDAKYSYTVAAGPQMPPGWKPAVPEQSEVAVSEEGVAGVGALAVVAVLDKDDPQGSLGSEAALQLAGSGVLGVLPSDKSDQKLPAASLPAKKVAAKAAPLRLQHLGMDDEDE